MKSTQIRDWLKRQNSKSLARIIFASGGGLLVLIYVVSSASRSFIGNKPDRPTRYTAASIQSEPRHYIPPGLPRIPVSQASPVALEGERNRNSEALLRSLVGSSDVLKGAKSASNEGSEAAGDSEGGDEGVTPGKVKPPQLDQISFVGWYDVNVGEQKYPRERVELVFTKFDTERRSVEVQIGSLDHVEWGKPVYAGTWDPDIRSGYNIKVTKEAGGARSKIVSSLFVKGVHFFGRKSALEFMLEGDTLYGRNPWGQCTERLTLTRVSRDDVVRESGPDPNLIIVNRAILDPRIESASQEITVAVEKGIDGVYLLDKWHGKGRNEGHQWRFKDGKFEWNVNGRVQKSGRFGIRETASPYPQVDFTLSDNSRAHGIYKRDDDRLVLCFTAITRARPNTFSRRASGGSTLIELRAEDQQDNDERGL